VNRERGGWEDRNEFISRKINFQTSERERDMERDGDRDERLM
jgi:hypothetical protein